jgi:hypothetical protein
VLSEVTGLRATEYIPEAITPPAAFVNIAEISPGSFGFDSAELLVELTVLTARSRAGQMQLDEYANREGTGSVWEALSGNKDLSLGDGTEATIVRFRATGIEEVAAYGYTGGVFELVVTT